MSDFKLKLSRLMNEQAIPEFMNSPINYNVDDASIIGEIAAAGPLYGLRYHGYEEGVASFSTYQPSAVTCFSLYLDDNDRVDTYDISAVVTDPLTHEVETMPDDQEIDLDYMRESQFIEYFIDVVIKSNNVVYNSVYVNDDIDTEDGEEYPFVYSASNQDDQDGSSDTFGAGYDELDYDETPLLIKISSVQSASPYGDFCITVHPKDSTKILIQCNYSQLPDEEDVSVDLETLNYGDFGDQFKKEFDIVVDAKYSSGDMSTTSAEYKSIESDNVLDIIVEAFKNEELIHIDMLLSEVTRVIKINFKGKKRIKMACSAGYKYDIGRKVCVKISGGEMARSRVAHRQMSRTKKALGTSYKKRITKKVKRAQRFRKLMGL